METAPLVERALAGILATCRPWAVAVFGSRARDDHAPDADLDLLVILDQPVEDPWREAASLRRAIGAIGVGVDVVVTDRVTWLRKSQIPGALEGIVAREGRMLDLHAA